MVIEDFLIKNFAKMPLTVRVSTYLFLLFLYAYLLLVPRFINGELLVQSASGGFIPYRSGEIRMVVEGRVFKFKANEDGVWSAPIVSRLPHTVKMGVYVVDADAFLDMEFKWSQLWTRDLFRIIISGEPPTVKIASVNSSTPSRIFLAFTRLLTLQPASAWAGRLELPADLSSIRVDRAASKRVEETVIKTVSTVTGKDVRQITLKSPLTGASAPSFVQRIEIIRRLESEFHFKIPDEHWNYLNTVGELVDYIQKRQLLSEKAQTAPIQPSIPTTNIPSGVQQRPIFKR